MNPQNPASPRRTIEVVVQNEGLSSLSVSFLAGTVAAIVGGVFACHSQESELEARRYETMIGILQDPALRGSQLSVLAAEEVFPDDAEARSEIQKGALLDHTRQPTIVLAEYEYADSEFGDTNEILIERAGMLFVGVGGKGGAVAKCEVMNGEVPYVPRRRFYPAGFETVFFPVREGDVLKVTRVDRRGQPGWGEADGRGSIVIGLTPGEPDGAGS